jgi:hypothetical protein
MGWGGRVGRQQQHQQQQQQQQVQQHEEHMHLQGGSSVSTASAADTTKTTATTATTAAAAAASEGVGGGGRSRLKFPGGWGRCCRSLGSTIVLLRGGWQGFWGARGSCSIIGIRSISRIRRSKWCRSYQQEQQIHLQGGAA